MRLADSSWPALACAPRRVLAVPLGATEQHGPHLSLTVDTEIAVELCERLAAARPAVVSAPAVPYGSSGEHAGFAGTLSIGRQATELLLVELGRSADTFAGVLFVSAHGGNAIPLRRAVALLREEGRKVLAWAPAGSPADSHAGDRETSVMLALHPDAVDMTRAEPGNVHPLPELMDRLRTSGVRGVSPNGVLGDPTGATAATGARVLARWQTDLLAAFDRWVTTLP
ncbi:MAG: mycofactocin biosynthesis peptidyl-dipeptidase MftE [Sciscionella sp.]